MKMKKIKNIAIIAFESKKTELIEWSYFNKEILLPHQLLALGFAANILEGTLNKTITKVEDIKLGGHRELCNLIKEGNLDTIIIFGNSEEIFEGKDMNSLLKTAVDHNIIVATNKTTADFVLHSSLIQNEYKIDISQGVIDEKETFVKTTVHPFAKAS